MLDKLRPVHERGIEAVTIARAEGVPIVFGTDLLGQMHVRQSGEFALRRAAVPAIEQLQSATLVAARLIGQEGRLGEIVPGAHADLLIVDGDPTRDLSPLIDPAVGVLFIMQAGHVVKDALPRAAA
jgi:imidazolonepropionase-like amidohydrolase